MLVVLQCLCGDHHINAWQRYFAPSAVMRLNFAANVFVYGRDNAMGDANDRNVFTWENIDADIVGTPGEQAAVIAVDIQGANINDFIQAGKIFRMTAANIAAELSLCRVAHWWAAYCPLK
jgi:hypothetical protein